MSRTRRRKTHGDQGQVRDGYGGIYKSEPSAVDVTVVVHHPERRERNAEARRLRVSEIDPNDTPVKPVRSHLWQFWRRW